MSSIYSSEVIPHDDNSLVVNDKNDAVLLAESEHNLVYRITHDGRYSALKTVRPDLPDKERHLRLLEREYRLLCSLQSVFIVSVIRFDDIPGLGQCLQMEYIDGRTLDDFVAENPSLSVRRQVLNEILEAIGYLHRKQIIHADIKPQTILITHNGNHVKLIDLGLADSDTWRETHLGNTRAYAAPEQQDLHSRLDQRTDIYLLGHIIRLLFPRRYRSIARRCLNTNPDKRYQSVDVLQNALNSRFISFAVIISLSVVLSIAAFLIYGNRKEELENKEEITPVVVTHTDTVQHHIDTVVKIVIPDTQYGKPPSPPKPVYHIDSMKALASRQHIRLRDECLDSIRCLHPFDHVKATGFFQHYRDISTQYMLDEIRRFPEKEMEIARIYDSADRFIYSPEVLSEISSLSSNESIAAYADLPDNMSDGNFLETIRSNVSVLYSRYLDSIEVMPDKYREFAYYYKKRAEILAQYAEETDKNSYPGNEGAIRNIYDNARVDFGRQFNTVADMYPPIIDADSDMVWPLEVKLNEMHSHVFDKE